MFATEMLKLSDKIQLKMNPIFVARGGFLIEILIGLCSVF